MKIRRPRGRIWRFLCTPSPYEGLVAALGVVTGTVASISQYQNQHPRLGLALAISAAAVLPLSLARTFFNWRAQARKETLHDLAGCLHTLLAVLTFAAQAVYEAEHYEDEDAPPFNDPRIRITVLVPINDGQDLEQVLDYVGDPRGGKTAGRVFPAQSGISGRTFRERAPWRATRLESEYTSYVQELVKRWGYTEKDARARDQESRSWMAVPLVDESTRTVQAIVYLDAVSPNLFFGNLIADLVLHACAGIALYADLRYD